MKTITLTDLMKLDINTLIDMNERFNILFDCLTDSNEEEDNEDTALFKRLNSSGENDRVWNRIH